MRGISWLFGRDGAEGGGMSAEELRRRILRAAVQATGLGIAALAIYAVSVAHPMSVSTYLSGIAETFSILALVGGAAFLTATVLGFLFGIPKTLQGASPGQETAYKINTSFEEISDWLTKMIIGVGLVELKSIPEALMTLNEYVAWALPVPGAAPVVGATVVFFGAAGLLVGYLATRLYISRAFKEADTELNRRLENAAKEAAPALEDGGGGGEGGAGGTGPAGSASSLADKGDTPKSPVADDPRVQKLAEEAEDSDSARNVRPMAARRAALALFLNEKYDAAVPYFERAGAAEMKDEDFALKYAYALGESGQRTRAVNFLEKMVRRRKGLPDAYKLLGYFYLWIPEKLQKGIDYTEKYLESRKDDAGARFNLACANAQLSGQNINDPTAAAPYKQKALEALDKAIAQDPEHWKRRARELRIADFWALKDDPDFKQRVDQ